MHIPFWLPEGHILKYGERQMRFEEAVGDGILRFRYIDGQEEIVLVPIGKGGEPGMPTVIWIIQQFRAGIVVDDDYNLHVTGRNEKILHLDRAACETIDPLTGWRFDWADAAIRDRIKKTHLDAREWIDANDLGGRKPSSGSLLRWMQKLKQHGGRVGALVSTAGRQKGQSQLPDVEDRLVHKWAVLYWRPSTLNGYLAHKEDAAAMVVREWDRLRELGVPYLSKDAPSAEAVRRRINSLECYTTHASRHGRPSADRKYVPSGEPVPVEKPFERIFMDGVEWEHSVYYSDELKIPVAKMRSVICMDAFSSWIAPHPTFAGEYRPQWGLRALRGILMPPDMTDDEVKADPEMAMFYGIPSDVMYDRDRTMISPRMVPGAIKVFSTVELAEAYHHDAKGKLENYHNFVKASLRHIPGRILGAREKHDIGYNPLKDTEVTRAQYVDMIEQCRRRWNSTAKDSLGKRSPDDVMRAFIRMGAARLADPGEVKRTFASIPEKLQTLTNNGLIYDNVHYRFNVDGTKKALSSNQHRMPFAKRLQGTAKIEVSIRVWDDDIDMIEVFDRENKEYVPMWSTDPGYTGGLNRWEHHAYQEALRKQRTGSRRGRLRTRGEYLEARQKTLSGKAFRERLEDVELLEAEERRLSGARGSNPACAMVPELHVATVIDGGDREDIPFPPPQNDQRNSDAAAKPPADEGDEDIRSDPKIAINDELFDADKWDFSGPQTEDEDPDEGEED
ncbi:hypothetical protein [uncultured Sphingomonas sp.]|uniref:hypothetical protein n=1 Tax=uncultured Sphingomonas sp. TaxID=158754 RepID=UPI0025E89C6C|nr:hypothetical protein [uncultured Sphingomonas sp.]